jgi:hypothetical protein
MKKTYRIIAIVLASLVLVIIILSFVAGSLVEAEARAYLKKHPVKGFNVEFDNIGLRLWSRTIQIKGINITSSADSLSPFKSGMEPETIQIQSIKLSGISLFKALKGEHFSVKKIELIHPRTRLMTEGSAFNTKKSVEKTTETGSDTTHHKLFKSIEIGSLHIKDGELAVVDSITGKSLLSSSRLGLDLKDVFIDSAFSRFNAAEIYVNIENAMLTLPGDIYQLKFGLMHIAKHDSLITFDSLMLVPLYPRYEFADVVGKQTDRFVLNLNSLGIMGIQFDSLLLSQRPMVRLVEVEGMHASIFRDKNKPFDYDNFPKLPHEALRTMKQPMLIEEVRIINGYAEYLEHEVDAEEPGMVFFDNINGTITNITSDSMRIIEQPTMDVNASLMLFGQGKLDASLKMSLDDPEDRMYFTASLGEMELKEVNSMIKPSYLVDISQGMIDKVTFSGTADRHTGKGNMTMLYHDLVIEVLKENKSGEVKRRWLISTLANELVKSDNPIRNQPVREVPLYFERDMNKGIINFLWKTCYSGVKETLKPSKNKDKESEAKHHKK